MSYPLEKRELIAEAPGLRMQILTLAAGQEVPWHWHSEVTDTFWCMDGPMVIEMRAPRESVELAPGQMHAVPAKRAHRVTGKGGERCRFAILQGIGTYDFQPVGGT
jgi:mannose-6-phosphate isomerase-like protein (cupin superfamily)